MFFRVPFHSSNYSDLLSGYPLKGRPICHLLSIVCAFPDYLPPNTELIYHSFSLLKMTYVILLGSITQGTGCCAVMKKHSGRLRHQDQQREDVESSFEKASLAIKMRRKGDARVFWCLKNLKNVRLVTSDFTPRKSSGNYWIQKIILLQI